jgi:hypothetical protein
MLDKFLFGNKQIPEMYFGNIPVAKIYFGNTLIWEKYARQLIMGDERFICIEYIPTKNLISSSQNPINISVFMNTNKYEDTTPPMWILDSAGVTCGYSDTGTVGAQETIDGCTGYKRTNTFRDNQLFLIGGKTYYIIYKINEWDTDNNYFAYYEDLDGHYKTWNINGGHTNVHDLTNKTDIGDISSFADVIEASNNDLFIWTGPSKSGLTNGFEYYRNNDSLNNYVPELNYGNTDKFEVLNHILMMDKGSGQYGGAGDKFVITETYTDGPIGLISRTSNYTSHVFIPPSQSFFHRNADAYKYIFDPAVNLTENTSLVWGNDYIYTYGSCYTRGNQYLNYSCYESRTSNYIDSPADISNVSANELFYIDDNVKDKFNTSKGLKLFGNVSFDAVVESPGALDVDAPKVFAAIASQWYQNKSVVLLIGNVNWPFGNKHTYKKNGTWNNMISSSTPLSTEPSNPQTNDVYYKAANVTWGNVTDECIVKYNGTAWEQVYNWAYSNYETDTDVSQTLFSETNINGILNEFQPYQLYQEENISTLVTRVEGDTDFVNATLLTGKRHYLEVTEVNGV